MHHLQGARGASLNSELITTPKAGLTSRPATLLLHIAVLVGLLDQASKAIVVRYFADHPPKKILGGIYLEDARNSGAAFSFATGKTIIFTGIALIVSLGIIRYASRLRSLLWATSLGLVLGGAVGNLLDRIFREPSVLQGHVVDWIDLRVWPVFNLADSGIVIGGLLGLVLTWRGVTFDGSPASVKK